MISRARAHEIAAAFLKDRRTPTDWAGVDRVVSPEELAAELPLPLRDVYAADEKWARSWIAYVRREPPLAGSSAVVLVGQANGEVMFAGYCTSRPTPVRG